MVRDFGIMIFQDFLLLVCVYLFLMPLHVMEKKKIKNGLILCGAWCVMLAARLLIPAIGEHLIAEFFMRFVITMIAVGLISKKISWEMIYCTVWPLIVYHCINIIWNSLHRVSAIEQQPRVLQYLFSLLFFAAVYLLLSITLFRWLPRNGFYQAGPRRTLSAAAVLFLSLFSYYILPEPWRIQSCGSGSVILRDFFVSAGRAFQKKRSKAGVCADGAHVVPAEEAVRDRERPDAGDRPQMSRSEVSGGCNAAY